MFTGIVEETGQVEQIEAAENALRLTVRARLCVRNTRVGDSIAVNGCCLTVADIRGRGQQKSLRFDLLQESWVRTNLQFARPGAAVNLERALPADGRLGGHFVTGHIDGLGRITRWEKLEKDYLLEVAAPAAVNRYILFKGSIAVDGISLTVAQARRNRFRAWIIPHTYEVTALRERAVGDAVNLEADLLGKYVEKFVRQVTA
jgi:riboflavin synthase